MTVRSVKAKTAAAASAKVRVARRADLRGETRGEKVARQIQAGEEVARRFRGALQMLADYDRGLIDRAGKPVTQNGKNGG